MKTFNRGNGSAVSAVGIATQDMHSMLCAEVVAEALGHGCRLFVAGASAPEQETLGQALRECKADRVNVCIAAVIDAAGASAHDVQLAVSAAAARIGEGPLDVALVRAPEYELANVWAGVVQATRRADAWAGGVVGCSAEVLEALCAHAGEDGAALAPAVVLAEVHPFCQQRELRSVAQRYGVAVVSSAPFAEGLNGLYVNEVLANVAHAHGKTISQVALRYLVEQDVISVVHAQRAERVAECMDVFDFVLTLEEMRAISALDTGRNLVDVVPDPTSAPSAMRAVLASAGN